MASSSLPPQPPPHRDGAWAAEAQQPAAGPAAADPAAGPAVVAPSGLPAALARSGVAAPPAAGPGNGQAAEAAVPAAAAAATAAAAAAADPAGTPPPASALPAAANAPDRIRFAIGTLPGFTAPPQYKVSASVLDATLTKARESWPHITQEEVEHALKNDFSRVEPARAHLLLGAFADASLGLITPLRHHDQPYPMMRGTANYGGVTCYIDSLVIAMFSRMENFQPLLYQSFDDRRTETMAIWLRMFVNLLRAGHMLSFDIMRGMLAACHLAGWNGGGSVAQQQDAAEFFSFVTEKLRMPLLSLRVDIAHAGREDADDDHKTVNEQLLYLPVPGNERDPPILFEECLELYFANNVEVNRHLERRGTSSSFDQPNTPITRTAHFASDASSPRHDFSPAARGRRRSYSIVSTTATVHTAGSNSRRHGYADGDNDSSSVQFDNDLAPVFSDEVSSTATPPPAAPPVAGSSDGPSTPMMTSTLGAIASPSSAAPSRFTRRRRSSHDGPGLPSYQQLFGEGPEVRDAKNRLWTAKNEVSFPAWMFLQLMPFYADSYNQPNSIENLEAHQVAQHFSKTRPVLGFVLKRYYFDQKGNGHKNQRRVIIPETIYLPSFVADDSDRSQAFGNFKLVLESAVFHRGNDLHSGHYTSVTSEQVLEGASTLRTGTEGHHHLTAAAKEGSSDFIRLFRGGRSKKKGKDEASGAPVEPPAAATTATASSSAPLPSNASDGSAEGSGAWSGHSGNASGAASIGSNAPTGRRRWLLADDLAAPGSKVVEVNFNTYFEYNTPYMLFYRMVQLDGREQPPAFDSGASETDSNPSPGTSPMLQPVAGEGDLPALAGTSAGAGHIGYVDKPRSRRLVGRPRFLRSSKQKDYASTYREEKCSIM